MMWANIEEDRKAIITRFMICLNRYIAHIMELGEMMHMVGRWKDSLNRNVPFGKANNYTLQNLGNLIGRLTPRLVYYS